MRILIACEESQRICIEFRKLGYEAYSCDVTECSGGHPEWHVKGDALAIINGGSFETMDGTKHSVDKWDLLIAHPPCTYLSNAGAARLYRRIDGKRYVEWERYQNGLKAKEFFMQFYNADCERIAIENPIPSGIFELPKYSQIIQPYEHGHPYSKKTCLWLKNLPLLKPTNIVEPKISWVSGGSKKADGTPRENKGETFRDSKTKSKTFEGIAKAIAEQWSKYIEDDILKGEKTA